MAKIKKCRDCNPYRKENEKRHEICLKCEHLPWYVWFPEHFLSYRLIAEEVTMFGGIRPKNIGLAQRFANKYIFMKGDKNDNI